MSIGSTLKHVLGIVVGILIPGASADAANLTHTVQQEMADKLGEAAADLAERLKLDTTGMSGPDKVFAITKALVAETKAQGFKGDLAILEAVALDVAQAAYRKTIPNLENGLVAIASAFHASPLVMVGVDILAQYVQQLANRGAAVEPAAQAA